MPDLPCLHETMGKVKNISRTRPSLSSFCAAALIRCHMKSSAQTELYAQLLAATCLPFWDGRHEARPSPTQRTLTQLFTVCQKSRDLEITPGSKMLLGRFLLGCDSSSLARPSMILRPWCELPQLIEGLLESGTPNQILNCPFWGPGLSWPRSTYVDRISNRATAVQLLRARVRSCQTI